MYNIGIIYSFDIDQLSIMVRIPIGQLMVELCTYVSMHQAWCIA